MTLISQNLKGNLHSNGLQFSQNHLINNFSPNALGNLLDMDPNEMPKDQDFVEWVSGNLVIKDSLPIAHRYGGYQFGHWVKKKNKNLQEFCLKIQNKISFLGKPTWGRTSHSYWRL